MIINDLQLEKIATSKQRQASTEPVADQLQEYNNSTLLKKLSKSRCLLLKLLSCLSFCLLPCFHNEPFQTQQSLATRISLSFSIVVCRGTKIPGNLSASSIPQIVMSTFDLAAVSSNGFSLYEEIFNGQLKNPNDCFVSHEYTGYCMVQALCNKRDEISDNSITRRLPISWWGQKKNSLRRQWA